MSRIEFVGAETARLRDALACLICRSASELLRGRDGFVWDAGVGLVLLLLVMEEVVVVDFKVFELDDVGVGVVGLTGVSGVGVAVAVLAPVGSSDRLDPRVAAGWLCKSNISAAF